VVVVVLILPDYAVANPDMQVARLELVVFDCDRVLLGHLISPLVNDRTAPVRECVRSMGVA
jgi:hypothetical protein